MIMLISGCANFYSSRYPNSNYSPTIAEAIPIYNNFPPTPYEVIGEVGAEGAPASSWSGIVKRMREYAAQIGGDAIVIQNQATPYVGTYNTPTTVDTTSTVHGSAYTNVQGSAYSSGNYIYGQAHGQTYGQAYGQSHTTINPGTSIPMYGKSVKALIIKFKEYKEVETEGEKSNVKEKGGFVVFDEQSMNDKSGYVPSGWMGDYQAVKVDYNYVNGSHSGLYCQKWIYSGKKTNGQGWAGVFWQNPPNNWGDVDGGFNLSGSTKLTFWARGEKGGEIVTFGMGGITRRYSDSAKAELPKVTLTKEWGQYTIDLKNKNLARVIGGFFWKANRADNTSGCTFYLDDIVYEQ